MLSKDEIFLKIRETLIEMFGFNETQVTQSARLIDDLDIDSIDAINISIKFESVLGQKIDLRDFRNLRTVGDVVEAAYLSLQSVR